jgi:hypothetical protein
VLLAIAVAAPVVPTIGCEKSTPSVSVDNKVPDVPPVSSKDGKKGLSSPDSKPK